MARALLARGAVGAAAVHAVLVAVLRERTRVCVRWCGDTECATTHLHPVLAAGVACCGTGAATVNAQLVSVH